MSYAQLPLLTEYYEVIESGLNKSTSLNGLESAVTFAGNRSKAIHNWFHFKEGFSADLFSHLGISASSLMDEDSIFVDPFCGSGTTILAGDLDYGWKGMRIGVEINPFLHFVATSKVQWREYDPAQIAHYVKHILSDPLRSDLPPDVWPKLSTFHRSDAFEAARVSALVDAVNRVAALGTRETELLLLGIASAAERLSYYRKDGRALRILRADGELSVRKGLNVEDALRDVWLNYAIQISEMHKTSPTMPGPGRVFLGDGVGLTDLASAGIDHGQVTMFGYSPPYLNHIDYTEVYKVELWLLGYVKSQAEMLSQRRRTLRSHASIVREADGQGLPTIVNEIIDATANEIEQTGKDWHRHFRSTAYGYFQDMKTALQNQFDYLVPGGLSFCVVANSVHGSGAHRVPVATDLLISEIASSVGFSINKLMIARHTSRNTVAHPHLRETVILFQKK